MQAFRSARERIFALLFIVGGVGWAAIILNGGGALLFWPALTSFLSGLSLILASLRWVTRPLTTATSIYGLVIALYQFSVAVGLSGSGYGGVAVYSIAAFTSFIVLYLVLLVFSLRTSSGS